MDPVYSPFAALDALRRAQGLASDALGSAPRETAWREAATFSGARLRAYGGTGPPLLILPAPFKRPYIWDLMPQVSVVRAALRRGFRVYLLEWLTASRGSGLGLEDYALRLPEAALDAIGAGSRAPAVLAGHSLGGTLAAIFASVRPERVAGLALVDAPLAFAADGGPLAAAATAAPPARSVVDALGDPVPGSAINHFSARAAPDAFVRQPYEDALACAGAEPEALAIHMRVRRWTLDEFPMPGRLFEAVAEDLYRSDRFRRGDLALGGTTARLAELRAPVAAVVNPAGLIVPPRSLLAGLRVAASRERLVLRYRPEPGPAIQHLGPLVAPGAHRLLWPRLLDWLAQAHA